MGDQAVKYCNVAIYQPSTLSQLRDSSSARNVFVCYWHNANTT